MSQPPGPGPFTTLGLPDQPGLTDDEVRAAWRRVAGATHPDRADGGNPARFGAAAAAYTALRTRSGRGEALAGLAARARRGRPAMLIFRLAATALVAVGAVITAGWLPATPAVITGAVTWLVLTARRDLAPPS
jgi:hypothetical protein